MKILFFGDVYGKPGCEALARDLKQWRQEHQPDFIIANAENAAHGLAPKPATLKELMAAGVDAFTLGNHWRKGEPSWLAEFPIVVPRYNDDDSIDPAARVFETALHRRVLLINLLGHAFIGGSKANYFRLADELLKRYGQEQPDAIVVDMHAEATSEKIALAQYLDGRVSAVVGTHTHVPTADTRILPGGTAFQSDIGMGGALNSVIGGTRASSESFLRREMGEKVKMVPLEPESQPPYISDAVLIDTKDAHSASSIRRLTTRP